MVTWETILEGIREPIDATSLSVQDIESLFKHLPEDEAARVADELRLAVESMEDDNELIANIVDTISSIAGIGLKIVKGVN